MIKSLMCVVCVSASRTETISCSRLAVVFSYTALSYCTMCMLSRCSLWFRSHLYRYLYVQRKDTQLLCSALAAFAFSYFIFHLIHIKCTRGPSLPSHWLCVTRQTQCRHTRLAIFGYCRLSFQSVECLGRTNFEPQRRPK